jgi:hypothetical protein
MGMSLSVVFISSGLSVHIVFKLGERIPLLISVCNNIFTITKILRKLKMQNVSSPNYNNKQANHSPARPEIF